MTKTTNVRLVLSAMRAASRRGGNPMNMHEEQEKMLRRLWQMNMGREARREADRSEAAANRWLARAVEDGAAGRYNYL